jgi:glutamate-1-semialdehyde 2,1-aminomutase
MPVGAFGGKREIMQHIAPLGHVYQAGTLSGNPLAMIAGFTLLKELKDRPTIYTELEEKGQYLKNGLQTVFEAAQTPFVINHVSSMISVHFSDQPVTNFAAAAAANNALFSKFFHAMLNRGIYLPPSAYESWFLSNTLTTNDLDKTIEAAEESLKYILSDQ